jgi:predicted acetyltransferase
MTAITIRPATDDQKPLVANLIQLYPHDMTEFMPFPVGPDGRFEYDFLERFWRFPYLVLQGDEIVGFALVVDACPLTGRDPCWFMAEFFVVRAWRGRGAGRGALDAILANHHGDWHIAVPHANRAAGVFWTRVLASREPDTSDLHLEGDDWRLRAFTV